MPNTPKEFVREFCSKHKDLDPVERNRLVIEKVKDKFGIILSRHQIYRAIKDLADGMKKSVDEEIADDMAKEGKKKEQRETGEKYRHLMIHAQDLKSQLDTLAGVKDTPVGKFKIEGESRKGAEATAVWVASDWHIEEVVEADKVNGLNEYNPEIAQKRASLFFGNALKLTDMAAKDISVKNVVLAALGDFISSNIHEELLENNALSPQEALILFRDIFVSGIKHTLKNSDYKLTVVCKDGNHGRATEKIRVSTRTENSNEWLIYHMIASEFRDDPRVKFIIERGEFTYLPVYNTTIRFLHGDSIKFAGGVGGIHIPLRKAIAQWDKAMPADLTVLGHLHQLEKSKKYAVNGSLIGWNPFAARVKADFERPQQTFMLVDKEWGPSIHAPIRVTEAP